MVSLEPSLLQTGQPQLSQLFFIGEVFQPSDHFCGASLDFLQHVHVLLVLWAPELNTLIQVGSHRSRLVGQNHLPHPAGQASFDTAQDAIGFLGYECMLLAHVQFFIHQCPQVLLCRAAFNHSLFCIDTRSVPNPCARPSTWLVEPHELYMGPILQPVKIPLDSISSLWQINGSIQLDVICKLAENVLNLTSCVIDEDIK